MPRYLPKPHTVRQAALASLAVIALRPPRRGGTRVAIGSFAAGWIGGDLAPQLLALGATDTALSAARRRVSPLGLALAGVAAAGFAVNARRASSSHGPLDSALSETLGAPPGERLPLDVRRLARPFRMTEPGVEVIRDVRYADSDSSRARLDIYRPAGADLTNAPVLFQIHGGAWTIGSKEQQGLLLMNRMAAQGWVCVAINYRLAPQHRWPAQIVDVKRALAWVHDNIASYGGNPDYVITTGGSAGGHLAALAALTPGYAPFQPGFESGDTRVQGCVPLYGVYDVAGDDGDVYTTAVRDGLWTQKIMPRGVTRDDFREASPINHVTEDSPDFFVLHGALDTLVSIRQANAFVERLRAVSQRTVSYVEMPGAQHAFDVFGGIRAHRAVAAMERWLQWHHTQHTAPVAG
ncbi:acetyl esterase/lipase [Nocardioides albertanoniae]|uniref:Acetyl esterase/lipase n=1 Tax=Nocardioides albertanoniae TaxID=1175486 RepID=A0A543A769_9ACTN|nr:alpha/beta hydrolase [Nocardioides albertanoniae]TQL68451.1 acetyl esterase/lipase [Nocardioides albertanoniae]